MKTIIMKHGPNLITGIRLALTPLFARYIFLGEYISAVAVFAAIGISDISDGAVARACGTSTRFGARMDVISDLIYILTSMIVLNITRLAPVVFTLIIVLKFVEFAVTSEIIRKSKHNSSVWEFDAPGRWFAFLVFISPGILCLSASMLRVSSQIVYLLLMPICALAVVSSSYRIACCILSTKYRRA